MLTACNQNAPDADLQIAALEPAYLTNPAPAKADSLVMLYAEAVKRHPDDHALNLRYLTKSAEIQFTKKGDAGAAVRSLDAAVNQHGQGQNLAEPLGLYARLWTAYSYKAPATLQLSAEDLLKMQTTLEKNQLWVDSALIRLDREMTAANGGVTDKAKANAFIETAEGYALLIQATNPDKYVDLLLKAAGLAKSIEKFDKALQLYGNISGPLPQHRKAPTALFMTGFIYANDLGDLPKAKAAYEEFLQRYPQDEMAESARGELKNLGKTPEQIIEEMEKENKKGRK